MSTLSTGATTTAAPLAVRRPGGVLEVAALAYPVVLQTFSDTMMHVVDSAFVGRIGSTELGAVGFSGIWLWTFLCAFVGTAGGVQTFVAQAYGAGRERECGKWIWQAMAVLLPAVLVWVALVALLLPTLITWLAPSPALQERALEYAAGRLPGMPAMIGVMIITSFFRGIGRTRVPLATTVVVNITNALLAYGLVFGRFGLPEWGVFGAGTATSVSHWINLILMLGAALTPRIARVYGTAPTRPRAADVRRFLRTSTPIGGQWVLDMASFAIFSTIIARMGDLAMAANQTLIQLLSLSFMQVYGLSIAAGALVGRYIGARDLESAERSYRSAMRLGLTISALVALAFLTVPDLLLSIFTRDESLMTLGRPVLVLGALFQIVDAVGILIAGSLRGAGDTRWPFVVQASLAWLLRLPVVYGFAVLLEGGLLGAWIGELLYLVVLAAALFHRFRSGAWRHVRV